MHPSIAERLIADRPAQALVEAHDRRLARAARANRPVAARPPLVRRWRNRLCVDIIALVAATVASASGPVESGSDPSTSRLPTEALTLVGLRATASEKVSYEPGAFRTWLPGPQIVSVKVLSGRLTVYGIDGERHIYVRGGGYAAGWAAYRSANETDERVETLVTHHVRP